MGMDGNKVNEILRLLCYFILILDDFVLNIY